MENKGESNDFTLYFSERRDSQHFVNVVHASTVDILFTNFNPFQNEDEDLRGRKCILFSAGPFTENKCTEVDDKGALDENRRFNRQLTSMGLQTAKRCRSLFDGEQIFLLTMLSYC